MNLPIEQEVITAEARSGKKPQTFSVTHKSHEVVKGSVLIRSTSSISGP